MFLKCLSITKWRLRDRSAGGGVGGGQNILRLVLLNHFDTHILSIVTYDEYFHLVEHLHCYTIAQINYKCTYSPMLLQDWACMKN